MLPLVIASTCAKKKSMYTQSAYTNYWKQIINQGYVNIDMLVRWTAVSAIQASSAPLYDLKHSGNKMFKIKTTDPSTSWLQQEIKQWHSTRPQGRPSGCAGNCEVNKNKESKAEAETEVVYR